MARAPFTIVALDTAGNVRAGATVRIARRSDDTVVPIYATEGAGASSTNPGVTDANGRFTYWADRGALKATISGSGIVTYDEPFDLAPAGDGTIDTAWASSGLLPIGGMMPYGGTADTGVWLLCDGRLLARAGTYAPLFGAIGTAFGAGDGSTTFAIPDLKGKVPLGVGTGSVGGTGLTARARGDQGGAESVALTVANLPSHVHDQFFRANAAGALTQHLTGVANLDSQTYQSADTTGSTGSNTPHANMPPFLAVNYLIRAV